MFETTYPNINISELAYSVLVCKIVKIRFGLFLAEIKVQLANKLRRGGGLKALVDCPLKKNFFAASLTYIHIQNAWFRFAAAVRTEGEQDEHVSDREDVNKVSPS